MRHALTVLLCAALLAGCCAQDRCRDRGFYGAAGAGAGVR